jgi:hypothetical protein
MAHRALNSLLTAWTIIASGAHAAEAPRALRLGRAGHAFDHLGQIGEQAETAAASGATIIYATGLGGLGYQGLPPQGELAAQREAVSQYNRQAKKLGIELSIGYLCATSIVNLDAFDRHWSDSFRASFKTPPSQWRQVDRQGKPLASWYGGDYQPACMSHPDWRRYAMHMVREQLNCGHDGIFFDNPTVHPQGCYCEHCMAGFVEFLKSRGQSFSAVSLEGDAIESARRRADEHPQEFLRFRSTLARDFLAHIRAYARTLNPHAVITCNNSLNSPDALYSQCRVYGYNINELSKVEDLVVVEDMVSQPRVENGQVFEYGPTYKQLHAVSRGKPVVAVTLARGEYHTPPQLMRLAIAEAAAHGASYLSWPTWPEPERQRMAAAVRPQADLLRKHERLLNGASPRADVRLFLPFRRWIETDACAASPLAAAMTASNLQYEVISEDDFNLARVGDRLPVLLLETRSVLNPAEEAAVTQFETDGGRVVTADTLDWLKDVQTAVGNPSLSIAGPATVRAVLRDQPKRSIIHLYNLDVERLSPFQDKATPASDIKLTAYVPRESVRHVNVMTVDAAGTSGALEFVAKQVGSQTRLDFTVPKLIISAIIAIE